MKNLIDKINPLLVHFGVVKFLNCRVFLLESVSSSNISSLNKIILQNIWKFKNILLKAVPGIFISKFTSATKVPQVCAF